MKSPRCMRVIFPFLVGAAFATAGASVFAAQEKPAPLSDRIVRYEIDAKLDVKTKIITGHETLTWRNTTDIPAADLWFHLYFNAFKNERSTFMKESGGSSRGFRADATQWGACDITRIAIQGGADLTAAMEFVQPDDDNKDDRTVMRVPLPSPSPPAARSP